MATSITPRHRISSEADPDSEYYSFYRDRINLKIVNTRNNHRENSAKCITSPTDVSLAAEPSIVKLSKYSFNIIYPIKIVKTNKASDVIAILNNLLPVVVIFRHPEPTEQVYWHLPVSGTHKQTPSEGDQL